MVYRYYPARLVRVVDGDTAVLAVDLGFRVVIQQSFRLNGYDAPERGQPGADEATAELERLLTYSEEWPITVTTAKGKSFDRWIATIYRYEGNNEIKVNEVMKAFVESLGKAP